MGRQERVGGRGAVEVGGEGPRDEMKGGQLSEIFAVIFCDRFRH